MGKFNTRMIKSLKLRKWRFIDSTLPTTEQSLKLLSNCKVTVVGRNLSRNKGNC